MEKQDIENYINKLIELDKQISGEDNSELSEQFIQTLTGTLDSLSKDIEKDMTKNVQNPIKMKVNFMKLRPDAITPSYSKDGDAGLDLTAIDILSDAPLQISYSTGIAIEIPRGYVGLVFPRSSIRKYGLELSNSVGVIDSGYRGEIILTFNKTNEYNYVYSRGARIGQLVIMPYPEIELLEVQELSLTERNDGGFGHTGD